MTIESNAMPDNYFSDLEESHEYYEDILLAVEFGVVNIEAGEPIYPDEPVTRGFAVSTLNFCLGYQLGSETEYTFTDYADCADPDSAQVAVDRGWFALVSGKFSPDLYITESEAERMLNDATTILEQTIVDDNYDSEFVFADDVIVVPDGTDVKEDGNGQISISDCPVTINKDDKFAV